MSAPSQYRLGDILANAITHGVGAIFALIGAVYLIVRASHGSAWLVTSCSIFATTLVLVYLCSTLYHSLVRTRARHVFLVLDHAAIYLLIAGTYTPFMLVSMRSRLGWTLLVLRSALYGVRRFDDFASELGAPRTVLADRLKRLTAAGLLAQKAVALGLTAPREGACE